MIPDQAPLKKHSVVGEDGELIQPDMTVDPDAYAEFVAIHMRPDPLWIRIMEHVRYFGCVYLIVVPIVLLIMCSFIHSLFANPENWQGNIIGSMDFIVVVLVVGFVVYKILRADTRQ